MRSMNKMSFKTVAQKGFTLLELMLGMGLAAGIVILALLMFDNASNSTKIKDEVTNLGSLIGAANVLFINGNYTGLSNEVLLKSSVFPKRMAVEGDPTAIRHGWSSAVNVLPVNHFGVLNDAVQVTYTNIPEDSCLDFSSKTIGMVEQVEVGGNVVTNTGEAAAACVGTVDIVFTGH